MNSITITDILIGLGLLCFLGLIVYMIIHSMDFAIAIIYTMAGVALLGLIGCLLCYRLDTNPMIGIFCSDLAMSFGFGGAFMAFVYLLAI